MVANLQNFQSIRGADFFNMTGRLQLPTAFGYYKRVKRIFRPRPVSNILYNVET